MKKNILILISLVFFLFNSFSHRGEFLAVEHVEVIDDGARFIVKFELENIKNIELTDVKLEFLINGESVKWKNILTIPSSQKLTSQSFAIYKEDFNPNIDAYQIEITKLFGVVNDWGGYDSPNLNGGVNRQKNELGYEVIADVPWRMKLKDEDGNLESIPVHVFIHDADGILGSVKLNWIDIKLKNAGLTSFSAPLTYNSLTNAQYKALFSCTSPNDPQLGIQEMELTGFSKSGSSTIDFDKTNGTFGGDHYKFDKKFAYLTFNIPPSSLAGYSNIIDVEVEMALKDKPNRTYRFRVFRSDEDIPKQANWYRGDTHVHSIYTQNDAETGLPLCATKKAAQLMGMDWLTTTDHTSDIDNYGQSIAYNWNRILQDIKQKNVEDNSMLYIPGQEVAVENSAGKLVHMLAYPGYLNPQNFPFLGDGDGDVSGTNVTVNNVVTALKSFKGFSYAAHPFATEDKLPKVPVGGGIWNLGDATFANNGSSYTKTGGNIIANDLSESSDIISTELNKYLKDAIKGGQIWNVRNSLETGDDDRDPWDVKNSSSNEFSKKDTNEYNHHIKKFRQGQEIVNHINKKGLYWKNQNRFLQNWKFYISAGSDAHGSFNFSNTDDFAGAGTISDNTLGKLTTVTYCPNGMGDNGENVLEAMYKGRTSLSDGPLLTIGVSTDGNNQDNELLMGDDGVVNSLLPQDYHLNLNYTTTKEFGKVKQLILYVGTETGELVKKIITTSDSGNNILSYNLSQVLASIFDTISIPKDEYFYVRAELQTQIDTLTNLIHRTTYEQYWSFSNPIWLQYKEVPLPNEFTLISYPNPFTTSFSLAIETPKRGDINIEMYDNLGNLIYATTEYVVEREIITFDFNKMNLSKGVYILRASMGEEKQLLKLVKL
jgi:hypothetical protein